MEWIKENGLEVITGLSTLGFYCMFYSFHRMYVISDKLSAFLRRSHEDERSTLDMLTETRNICNQQNALIIEQQRLIDRYKDLIGDI